MEIGLLSCTKSKKGEACKPGELYTESDLFNKMRDYAVENHDDWFVLSAKHGLLDPEGEEISPYDVTLRDFSVDERREWGQNVFQQLKEKGLLDHKLVLHLSKPYYEYLIPLLESENAEYSVPTEGLQLGETKSWYKQRNSS